MTSRTFRLVLVLALLLVAGGALVWMKFRKPEPASFILVTIDTLRADRLGCYGYKRNITPGLDRLASEGILFDQAFCVMPTTLPSHGSIFFGTWPRIHGSTSNFIQFSGNKLPFLPRLLQQAGYSTAAFLGTHHLGKHLQPLGGFDRLDFPEDDRKASDTLAIVRKWFANRKDDKQFFVWIHLWDPHSPYALHPKFIEKIRPGYKGEFPQKFGFIPRDFYTPEQVQVMKDLYDNEIAYTDFHLTKFLDDFRKTHDARDTTIIIASDHGETLDELVSSQDYAFDHGEFLYEHQIRVPLLILSPRETAGRRIQRTVTLLDVMPTVLKQANLPVPATCQGASLAPYLKGRDNDGPDQLVFLQRRDFSTPPRPFLAGRQYAVREHFYKLFYDEANRRSTLYSNKEEYIEAQQPKIAQTLEQRLQQWLKQTEPLMQKPGQSVSEEEAQKLRELGYVQ